MLYKTFSIALFFVATTSVFAHRADSVSLFSKREYRGASVRIHKDDPDLTNHPIGRIASIQVPRGCEVVLFARKNYKGFSITLDNNNPDTRRLLPDQMRSLRVLWKRGQRQQLPRRNPQRGNRMPDRAGVIVYNQEGFRGREQVFREDVRDFGETHLGNNALASIRVPPGCVVTLFEKKDFRGRREVFRHSDPDLGDNRLGAFRASSMAISYESNHEVPTDPKRGVTLFQHVGFKGRSQVFSGDIPDLDRTWLGNDQVSSLSVPRGFQVTLYEHSNFRGRSEVLRGDDADLRNNVIGNDRASSLRIERAVAPIRLFSDKNFRGRELLIEGDIADLSDTPIGNDALSSIKVPPGWRVVLYKKSNFRGKRTVLTDSMRNMKKTKVGNDEVSSISVEWIGRIR